MTRSAARRHRPAAAVADNWVSRGYLIVFAALLIWVVLDKLVVSHPDASFAGVWLFFWTLPTSLVLLPVPGLEGWPLLVCLALVALVNATLLGLLVRALTRSGHDGGGRPRLRGSAR
ncbi:MAG TPA: hypothetical protein VFH77_18205 [Streptomyces sp.]|jgi:hypothetical protein|nr:hypothetical protein [Streptomyces sp.]